MFSFHLRSSEDKDIALALSDSVHLHKELGLDTPSGVAFALGSASAEGIYLVNEDNGPSSVRFACHLKKVANQTLRFTLPFADQIGRRYGEECCIGFGRHSLGQV